jgi:hypothetical protein
MPSAFRAPRLFRAGGPFQACVRLIEMPSAASACSAASAPSGAIVCGRSLCPAFRIVGAGSSSGLLRAFCGGSVRLVRPVGILRLLSVQVLRFVRGASSGSFGAAAGASPPPERASSSVGSAAGFRRRIAQEMRHRAMLVRFPYSGSARVRRIGRFGTSPSLTSQPIESMTEALRLSAS